MKQVLQSLRSGVTEIADVPAPNAAPGELLIRSTRTLISTGTERMLVEFGRSGLLAKARQQPDKVKVVMDKVRTDGLVPTMRAVAHKLDQPLPLGYCNVGVVIGVGRGVVGYAIGDRVASNGKHAEIVSVPANLCAGIPAGVSDDAAAFTVLGAIALQGIRLVVPTLGEAVVVVGLGLIGLLTVQLLRANGCRVLGIDYDPAKLALARGTGADTADLACGQDPVAAAGAFSRWRGVDAVIITAATASSEPVHQAALMCRQRGRIVLVGVTGLELARDDFYKKELTFQVSCSYGPGRYDPRYETTGLDYPIGFVRWTEQRNLEAVLDMMADGRLDVAPLISHRFAIDAAGQAYELVTSKSHSLGILLEYPPGGNEPPLRSIDVSRVARRPAAASRAGAASVSFIGAGNYATAVLIPAFRSAGARLRVVASSGGVSGINAARRFGFERTTTDTESVLADPESQAIVITTRHDSHARLVLDALAAGKDVFVEKPLCLTLADLAEIEALHARCVSEGASPRVMVGFNRRFAPQVCRIMSLLRAVAGPKAFVITVNAGVLPADHWTHDARVGGGRIIGEGCHFVDLLRFLAGASITGFQTTAMSAPTHDTASISLTFEDGSIGTVHYFANGNKALPKERVEVFAGGRVLQLDNYRRLKGYGWPGFTKLNLWKQDKGQQACAAAFVDAVVRRGASPIPFGELVEVSRATIEIGHALGTA
jgi:predicted dehydrogenase/threonine dehydrogenase-like Zn-dependent dehydrogenase